MLVVGVVLVVVVVVIAVVVVVVVVVVAAVVVVAVVVVVVVVVVVAVVVGPDVFWVPIFIRPSGYLITLLDFLEVREGEADNVLNVKSSFVLLPYSFETTCLLESRHLFCFRIHSKKKTNGLASCTKEITASIKFTGAQPHLLTAVISSLPAF